MRLVLDTNVLVAALRSDGGASRQLLLAALDGKIQMIASVPLIIEYEAVLTKPSHLAATGLSAQEMNAVLDALTAVAEPVLLHFHWRPQLKGPADEVVLETVVNGRADRLVTFNLRHLRPAARAFGIPAATPPEAWKESQRRQEKNHEKK